MTDANEAREVLPILFLGRDPRFVQNPETRDDQVLGRTRDFRPGLHPQGRPFETQYTAASKAGRHLDMGPHAPGAKRDEEDVEEESGPKGSPVTEPASGSGDASLTGQSQTTPETPVDAVKEKTNPLLTNPVI